MFVTRGRTRRSAPTRRFCIRQAGSICYSVAMSGRIRQAERVFVAIRKAFSNRNAREGTAALPYAEMLHPTGRQYSLQRRHEREDTASGVCVASPSHSRRKSWISRCAVECGVGGPLAGLVSFRILQASTHSAAGRAGTILDGNIRNRNPNSLHPPSGMVDPLGHQTVRPSPAEPRGQRDFAYHPATSARTRCIHRVSGERVCGHPKSN
jgi:hypothetical protein